MSILLIEGMENIYKKALKELKASEAKPSALFETPWVYGNKDRLIAKSAKTALKTEAKEAKQPIRDGAASDNMTTVLESLTQFGGEKLENKDNYKFSGGELKKKSSNYSEIITSSSSKEELLVSIEKAIGAPLAEQRFKQKALQTGTQVVFLTDEYFELSSEAIENNELETFFDKGVSALFSKMIKAMGLEGEDFFLTGINLFDQSGSQLRDLALNEIFYLKPRFVITLGAIATNALLGSEQRLKNIHGKLFDFKITNQDDKL